MKLSDITFIAREFTITIVTWALYSVAGKIGWQQDTDENGQIVFKTGNYSDEIVSK